MRLITDLDFPGFFDTLSKIAPDIEAIHIGNEERVPNELQGDILLTMGQGIENLTALLQPHRGIRWIHVFGAGVDGFPLHLVGNRLLTCSRGANASEIAEWAMAMLLTDAKGLPKAWLKEPPMQWNYSALDQLSGKTLALVGFGKIGTAIARRALPFEMTAKALVRSPRPSPLQDVELVDSLQALLADADYLVLAAPSTPSTHHLLDKESLQWVKPGLHLINVARGNLIDQSALKEALDDHRIRLASLDVMEPEPLPAGHWLYSHPKVRVSPHISWSSPQAMTNLLTVFIKNLQRFQRGEGLEEQVDLMQGY